MHSPLVLMRWLPHLLLVLVACVQMVLAHRGDLTPWKGGGFGMFSTLDHGAYRGVDVLIEAPNRSEALEIPPSLEIAAARAAAYPADWLLRDLAAGVAAREARYDRRVDRVTLTVWRTRFDSVTLSANQRPLRTFVYAVR